MYEPHDRGYSRICDFAQTNYTETLSIKIGHFPDILFAIEDEKKIFGCIGLNRELQFNLFTQDKRLQDVFKKMSSKINIGEQSILVVKNYQAGMLLLIATLAVYAQKANIHRVAYAGGDIIFRAINYLELPYTEIGSSKLQTLTNTERENYSRWYEIYHPTTYLLNPSEKLGICGNLFARAQSKVKMSEKLNSFLYESGTPYTKVA